MLLGCEGYDLIVKVGRETESAEIEGPNCLIRPSGNSPIESCYLVLYILLTWINVGNMSMLAIG